MRRSALVLPALAAAFAHAALSCVPASTGEPAYGADGRARPTCESVAATGDARADVSRLAAVCAPGMKRVPGELSGTQGTSDPSQRSTLVARGDQRCFRIVAAGDVGVGELDVQITGPDGVPLVRDGRRGPLSVVPDGALLCLPDAGPYTLEVAVTAGRGSFVAQVYAGR